jgi:predicted N-acetyltransferase YhbS
MAVTMGLLADHPEHLPTVAGWIHHEWGSWRPGSSPALVAERLQSHLRRSGLPLMVLALDGAECVGCASLRAADLEGREDLSPWLASVYVPEARRRAGIGTQLVRAAELAAARQGVATLYLFTPDRQAFYAARGWETHAQAVHAGRAVTIMHKRLGGELSVP